MWWNSKRRSSRPFQKNRKPLALEALEERCLLDASAPTQFGSADAFKQYLIDTALTRYASYFGQSLLSYYGYYGIPPQYRLGIEGPVGFGGDIRPGDVNTLLTATAMTAADLPTSANTSFSQTNVQVQGVDEGDIVKNDGNYIYEIRNNELVIAKAWPAQDLSIVSRTTIEGRPVAEYLSGDRVTVISDIYGNNTGAAQPVTQSADAFPVIYSVSTKVKITVLDVSDRTAPQQKQATYLDGSYLDSRAIGNEIYVVEQNYYSGLPAPAYTTFNGTSIYETKDQYLARIKDHELDLALPHFYTSSGDANNTLTPAGYITDPAEIFKPQSDNSYELVSVLAVDMTGDGTTTVPGASMLSVNAPTVYASTNHLYLLTSDWSGDGQSLIMQFTLDGAKVSLTASGNVPGQVNDQFSMDEHGQYFRIVTTSRDATISNALYVFTADSGVLKQVGSLTGLAPGEKVYSARFMDDRAFIVTFRQFDPLFAVDLSDPTNPKDVGELKLPGFSKYLQPIDDTHLLGVGADVASNNESTTLKIALFDVSDLTAPREVDSYDINPPRWRWWWGTGSEAAWDHHALGYFPEYQTLAIPVYGTYTGIDYSTFVSSLWVFKVDPAKGFTLAGTIDHDSQVRRSLRIGDQLYSIADNSIQVHPILDPTAAGTEARLEDVPRLPTVVPLITAKGADLSGPLMTFRVSNPANLQATINWGDGTTSPGTIGGGGGGYFVKGDHVYANAGNFTPTVNFARAGTYAGSLSSSVKVTTLDPGIMNFLNHAYQDLLGRTPDGNGVDYFGGLLQNKTITRAQVAQGIAGSVEYHTREVQNLYVTLLGRSPEPAGLDTFVSFLGKGGTTKQVKAIILGSPEYYQRKGGNPVAFLVGVYNDVLGRGIDAFGASVFAGAMARGASTTAVAGAILTSPEAARDMVEAFFQTGLHRTADPTGLNGFSSALQHGMSDETVLATIVGSQEYYGRQ